MKVALAIAAVGWLGFSLWTVKQLWRSPDDPHKARYFAEVRLGGLAVTVLSSLVLPIEGGLPAVSYWPEVAYWAFALFPIMMWTAYFGFRLFHSIVD